ncbi:roadblock/LC7 domain-containing protein [Streptomyces sp. L2]|uniref:roadblock/LC7 domain-containing protein n=1 Tax=Streptomyces sp. L2 TaxID=2162665 RepID=UPI0010137568|nr:roadblock/LC7 domain-containing protein [Streptomyces sp. L2]
MNAVSPPVPSNGLGWLMDELVRDVPEVQHALLLSSDGLPTAASASLTREDCEHLAAVASGLHSLAKGAGHHFDVGGVQQTLVELDRAFLFITAAGDGSCLAVLSSASADPGLVAFEMATLVKRVGEHLGAGPRTGVVPDPAGRGEA